MEDEENQTLWKQIHDRFLQLKMIRSDTAQITFPKREDSILWECIIVNNENEKRVRLGKCRAQMTYIGDGNIDFLLFRGSSNDATSVLHFEMSSETCTFEAKSGFKIGFQVDAKSELKGIPAELYTDNGRTPSQVVLKSVYTNNRWRSRKLQQETDSTWVQRANKQSKQEKNDEENNKENYPDFGENFMKDVPSVAN